MYVQKNETPGTMWFISMEKRDSNKKYVYVFKHKAIKIKDFYIQQVSSTTIIKNIDSLTLIIHICYYT